MLEVLSDILLACKSSPQPKRALGQSGVGGGLEREEKPGQAQGGPGREEEAGGLAGNHCQDLLLSKASESELSHTLFGWPLPQFSVG